MQARHLTNVGGVQRSCEGRANAVKDVDSPEKEGIPRVQAVPGFWQTIAPCGLETLHLGDDVVAAQTKVINIEYHISRKCHTTHLTEG